MSSLDVCASTWKQEAVGMVFPSFFHSAGFFFFFLLRTHHVLDIILSGGKKHLVKKDMASVFMEFVLFAGKTNIAYTNQCKFSAVQVL